MSVYSSELIKKWLEHVFFLRNFTKIDIKIVGNAVNGDGFVGDVLFVKATGRSSGAKMEEFNLVLKCRKENCRSVDQARLFKSAFYNEFFVYDIIQPIFRKLQSRKSVNKPFNSIPKFYEKFFDENIEVIVLENLKLKGFKLWPKEKPMDLQHIKTVLVEYGKFHALSVAMQDQEPEEFLKIRKKTVDNMGGFYHLNKMREFYQETIVYTAEQVKDLLDEKRVQSWLKGKEQIHTIYTKMRYQKNCLRVLTHGDCWNNNFMFKYKDNTLEEVVILDWQMTAFHSPILDLSYFLFTCISPNDVELMDEILDVYYQSFTDFLCELESVSEDIYPKKQFLADWKKFLRYGAIMSACVVKMVLFEEDQTPDISKAAENGGNLSDEFNQKLSDPTEYRRRIINVVKYIAENNCFD